MDQENINHGNDQNILNNPQGNFYFNSSPESQWKKDRGKLLAEVEMEVGNRLEQSLHRAVDAELINLGKASQPYQVRTPWQMEQRHREQSPVLLPPETTITEVFDQPQVRQKLLILGEPGSGKTTTMLELARSLVDQALKDSDRPIPVLLSLSSWKPLQTKEDDPFLPWLLAELKTKYGLNSSLSEDWLAKELLLPMLDGLDEVATDHQQACARAINAWLTGDITLQPPGLVVCCRIEAYERVVRHHLFLHDAIALQPLADGQIEAYLQQFDLRQVWDSAQESASLRELLETPLFLSVFGLVAAEGLFDPAAWQQHTTEAAQQTYLWERFWLAAMQRPLVAPKEKDSGLKSKTYGKRTPPTQKQLRRALVFAARGMAQEPTTELLIERMQPRWLPTAKQRWHYRLIVGLIVGLIGGLIGGLKADIDTRIQPNQGIKNSARNMAIVLTLALVLVLPFKLLLEMLLLPFLDAGIVESIVGSSLVALVWVSWYAGGGLALAQHVALRLVPWLHGYAPLRYDLLLNYATERLLLQRIGGRYRFTHKLLQDYFAAQKF